MAAGLTTVTPPVQPDEPTEEELLAPLAESGLLLSRVNNFEFVPAPTSDPPAGVYSYGDELVTFAASFNQTSPIAGTADLRFDFTFSRIDGEWNEWVDVGVPTDQELEQDISGFSQISITMATDRPRTVRVRLASPAYVDAFAEAWTEFGTEFSVTPTPKTFKMRLDTLYYPDWAKEDWVGTDKGWTTSDSEALSVLLRRFTGLLFAPMANTDTAGELVEATDTGTLQIDNIYFQ